MITISLIFSLLVWAPILMGICSRLAAKLATSDKVVWLLGCAILVSSKIVQFWGDVVSDIVIQYRYYS